jgi:Fe-S oxidoreductase
MTPSREEFLHISPFEKYLFYFLIYLSLAVMAFQIAQRVRVWLQGKEISWSPASWRGRAMQWVGNFWTYVLAQRKVKSSRKRSGAPMHLMIFYGFLALFVATTLLAINTYSPWKFHQGLYYMVYEVTFDVLGLVFVVGVAWALFRRLKLANEGAQMVRQVAASEDDPNMAQQLVQNRRFPLSHAANDLWTLALLLTIGLTGYWLEAARISVNPQSFDWSSPVGYAWSRLQGPIAPTTYKAIWWFHMVWVMVFFAVIPRMRIRHIVMAIFSTAGKPDRTMGELAPITMEEVELTEKIGASHAPDLSRWHLMSLDACMECGRCTEVCPAWKVGKVLNPKQVVQDTRRAAVTGAALAETISEEALWQCTTCNACVEACPVLIRHVDVIVDARRNLVAEGRFSGTGSVVLRQIASTGNAWGAPSSSREDWMKDLGVPLAREKQQFEVLFWVGCAGSTDPGAIKTSRAFAELLNKAGVDYACLGNDERCTGDPARRIGEEFLYQEQAMANIETFRRYGVKRIVTPCPHCFNTLAREYGQFMEGDPGFEVMHHSQLLAELIDAGKLQGAHGDGETTFHDPCYLARINNESDAPRAALGKSTDLNGRNVVPDPPKDGPLLEPPHYARKTLCCGAGGGRMWMEEPPSKRPGDNRARELLATGAKTVAVACPFCRIMLDASIKGVTEEEIRLVDLAEAVRDANRSGD